MKSFTVRLQDDIEKQFELIKDSLGLKNDSEVVRYLIKNHRQASIQSGKQAVEVLA